MVTYNPKEWLRPLYQIHKSDTVRKLTPMMLLVGAYSAIVVYVEIYYLQLTKNSYINNITLMHSLLGFAISMLLVFRTNSAYDRWWEGRKLWGALVNSSRNLAVKLDAMLEKDNKPARDFFTHLLKLFPLELRLHLQQEKTRLELDASPHPEIPGFDRSSHIPAQIVKLMQGRIKKMIDDKELSYEQWWLLNAELVAYLDICGACERIKNTPIPWSYSTFIKKFIFIYVITLPLALAFSLGYITVPVVIFIFYVLASLEVIAEEIEDPFGTDSNDLPMEKITETISKNVMEILG